MVSCGTPGCSCTPIPYDVDFCPGCGSENFNEAVFDEYECADCGWNGDIVAGYKPVD